MALHPSGENSISPGWSRQPRGGAWCLADWLWLGVSQSAGLFFALNASWSALGDYYRVHDDARQHLFWVPGLTDPELFRNDPIASYYQAQAPLGFIWLWRGLIELLDPIVASKLIPLLLTPLLVLFAYLLARRLTGRAAAAGLTSIILAWSVWQYDDVASATPRAFASPLLVAFLYFVAANRHLGWLSALALQGLFYPLGCVGMLAVIGLRWLPAFVRSPKRLATSPETLRLAAGLVLAASLFAIQYFRTREYGATVSAAEARSLPEFRAGGRTAFFIEDPWKFWLEGRSGLLAFHVRHPGLPELPVLAIPMALALALAGWALAGRARLLPAPEVSGMGLAVQLLVSSVGLFALAHVLLFTLYLPARHVQFSLPVVWALAGGLFLALLAEAIATSWPPAQLRLAGVFGTLAALTFILDMPPPGDFYVQGQHPQLYDHLLARPKSTLVAAQAPMASFILLFAERPVLYSSEHALPYHRVYYEALRDRLREQERAFAAETTPELVRFAERYGVGVLVARLDEASRRSGRSGPAIEQAAESCAVFRERDIVILPVDCLQRLVR